VFANTIESTNYGVIILRFWISGSILFQNVEGKKNETKMYGAPPTNMLDEINTQNISKKATRGEGC